MPPQASEDSPEGAAAFVQHYVNVFNYAAATGDVAELTRLSAPTCKGCQSYITLYRDTYAAGGYFKGGDWKIGEVKIEMGNPESFATTDVQVQATTYREDSDARETSGPSESSRITFALVGSTTGWSVSQLALGDAR